MASNHQYDELPNDLEQLMQSELFNDVWRAPNQHVELPNGLEQLMQKELFGDVFRAPNQQNDEPPNDLEQSMQDELLKDVCAAPNHKNEESMEDLELLMLNELFEDYHYSYSPLEESNIRLLRLEPGHEQAYLQGSIFHVSLDEIPDYEALSYAWGSPLKSRMLYVDGAFLPITESLHVALKRLRHLDRPRVLWIDAVCINQADNLERSKQIVLMHQIYSLASCVLCWLGEDGPEDVGAAIRLIKRIHRTSFSPLTDITLTAAFMAESQLPPQYDEQWEPLCQFWQRAWFRRAWIIQEFSAGRAVRMLCGAHEVDWRVLGDSAEKIQRYRLLDVWGMQVWMNSSHLINSSLSFAEMVREKILDSNVNAFENWDYWVDYFAQRDESCLKETAHVVSIDPVLLNMAVKTRRSSLIKPNDAESWKLTPLIEAFAPQMIKPVSLEKSQLMYLASNYHSMECSEPRDKLFAYFALSKDAETGHLQPDYAESIENCYTRFARHYISLNDSNTMHCLFLSGIGYKPSSKLKCLPSWVPDWTDENLTRERPLGSNHSKSQQPAAGKTKLKFRLGNELNEIYTAGSFLGRIAKRLRSPKLAQIFSYAKPKFENTLSELVQISGPVLEQMGDLKSYFEEFDMFTRAQRVSHPEIYSQETESDLQWRLLMGNVDRHGFVPDDSNRQHYQDMRSSAVSLRHAMAASNLLPFLNTAVGYSANLWFHHWASINSFNVVCQLDNGLLAMAPVEARIGDLIYLPYGLSLPLALRSLPGASGKYQFLGVSYVHGRQNGEALGLESWKEEEICLV